MRTTKTRASMQNYLKKLDAIGLRKITIFVPNDCADEIMDMADAKRTAYLHDIANFAQDGDPRISALASSNLTAQVGASLIAGLRANMKSGSQIIEFDKKVLTMQEAWSNMIQAQQSASSAQMRDEEADRLRYAAKAAACAATYRRAKDGLLRFVQAVIAD